MKFSFCAFVAIAMHVGGSALLDATTPRVCENSMSIFCSSWGWTGWSMRFISIGIGALAIIERGAKVRR